MSVSRFIEPLDILNLRGNQLFDGAGAYSAPLMPPWPSLVAGALRSRMLADADVDAAAYGHGELELKGRLKGVLGTPEKPGTFTVHHFGLARKKDGIIEPLYPLPSDMVVYGEKHPESVYRLDESKLPSAIRGSSPFPVPLILRVDEIKKALSGCWLTAKGMSNWTEGRVPEVGQLVTSRELWKSDPRLGIGINSDTRTVDSGQLYSVDSVAMEPGVGFVVAVAGADNLLPPKGILRFGGDGRGASIEECTIKWPEPDWSRIEQEKQFILLTTSPSIYPDGCLFPGQEKEGICRFRGVEVKVVSAAIPRFGVVSGWDLAHWQPKAAQRVVPSGSVYHLKILDGEINQIKSVIEQELSPEDAQRRAEGFNRVWFANAIRATER